MARGNNAGDRTPNRPSSVNGIAQPYYSHCFSHCNTALVEPVITHKGLSWPFYRSSLLALIYLFLQRLIHAHALVTMLFSPAVLLAAALLFTVIHVLRRASAPIAKLPGPAVSKFTSLWLKWKEMSALRTVYIHSLHEEYGPVVRVAPNEVSFTSWAAVKEIYCSGGSGYDKTEFYDLFRIYGRR